MPQDIQEVRVFVCARVLRLYAPCPLSTKLAIVFAALEERKKLAFSPSLSAAEKVL